VAVAFAVIAQIAQAVTSVSTYIIVIVVTVIGPAVPLFYAVEFWAEISVFRNIL
jgi:hypothetical protein